jgi:hypothetical protein
MLAIDTSLIVRYLTGDHPEQSERTSNSSTRMAAAPVYVCEGGNRKNAD